MTLEQTRQLGIEFERRIQTMIPETEFYNKLDTETIYSYLNQFQDKLVHDVYKSLDGIPTPSKPSAYIETILQGFLQEYETDVFGVNGAYRVSLPTDFGLYLNSRTEVERTYSYKQDITATGSVPNTLISQSQMDELRTRPQDNMRIMRQPIACLSNNKTIEVIYDRYTTPKKFIMQYYRTPRYMDLMTSTPCELPPDCFEDVVSGAVDLYVQYAAGAEARKRQLQEQQQKRNKEDEQ